jgi:hypothetical protein
LVAIASLLVACATRSSRPIPWQTATDSAGDADLSVMYALDTCQDLDRIEVAYSLDAVTVTVFTVSNDRACTGVHFIRSADVPLRERLAGRAIRDGAR